MDSIFIKQLVDQQLAKKGITDGAVYILEKKWGYVVQIDYANNMAHANELFDKDGNIIYPLSNFQSIGGVYLTEVEEVIEQKYTPEIMERIKGTAMEEKLKCTIAKESSVQFRELDDNHFIIPNSGKKEIGNVLFFIEQDNTVTYKGYIKGKILGNILTEDKKLMEQKQVLSCVEIDSTRDEYEYFFYSWDKNCRVSDKWSTLYKPQDTFRAEDLLTNKMKLPREFALGIVECMQSNGAWLATLNLNSKDNKHHEYFVCLVGIDGLPLMDLKHISQLYEVKTIPLKKEKIGEVDNIKTLLQEKMNQTISQIEEKKDKNKRDLTANFFKGSSLEMNDAKFIKDSPSPRGE